MTFLLRRGHIPEAPDTVDTPRLILRQVLESDVDHFARMYADEEVTRFLGEGRTLTRDQTWRAVAGMLGHWVLRGYGQYALEERTSGRVVGVAGLLNPEGWPGIEVAYTVSREHWGMGFATETATAVVQMAYEALSPTHLISMVRPDNLASIRVAEKVGGVRETTIDFMGGPAHIYAYSPPLPIDQTLKLPQPR